MWKGKSASLKKNPETRQQQADYGRGLVQEQREGLSPLRHVGGMGHTEKQTYAEEHERGGRYPDHEVLYARLDVFVRIAAHGTSR